MQLVGEARQLFDDRLVAADQPVVGEHRRNRDDEAKGGHDQRLADRAGDGVDRGLTGGADLHEGAIDADDGSEQSDERSGRTHGGEEGEAARKTRLDSALAARQRVEHPIVLVDRIGQLVMLLKGEDAVVDDLPIGAVLLQLGSALAQVRRLPEAGAGAFTLVDDLLLLEQLDEQDVP